MNRAFKWFLALGLLATFVFVGSALAVTDAQIKDLKSRIESGQRISAGDISLAEQINATTGSYIDVEMLTEIYKNGGPIESERPSRPSLDEYIWSEIDPEWIDISETGTDCGILNDDHNVGPFNLGFDFSLFDNTYNSIRVCSNGWASFTSTSTAYFNGAIPATAEPNSALYPFWDDMYPPDGGYQVLYYADAANSRFIVSWINMPHINDESARYSYQIVLFPSGNMHFNYDLISTTAPANTNCTVGIENATGTEAVQVCYNGTGWLPTSGTSILIGQPDGVPSPVTNLTAEQVGSDVVFNWLNPTQDTNGNPITPTNVQVWLGAAGTGTLIGTVGTGIQTYTHVGAPDGNLTYNVRAFLDPYYGAPTGVSIVVGNPSYVEDFENTAGLWESDNESGWQWGTPTNGPGSAHGGDNCWGTVLTADYPTGACFNLTLDPGLTVASAGATVEFWAWYDTELAYDGCNFKVSSDGGTTWEIVDPVRPYDQTSFSTANLCQPAERGWAGHAQGFWEYLVVPIGDYVGQALQYRLTFGSDGSVQYAGFFFDDMTIWGLSEPIGADVSGTVTLDGGAGDVTATTVRADGLGNPVTNPAANGAYTLTNVLVGQRLVWATLAGYHDAATTINLTEGGMTGVNLTLVRLDPPVPTGLEGEVNNGTGLVTLDWDNSTDPLVDSYNVYRRLQGEDEWNPIGSSATSDYDETLTEPGIYQYAVSAVDAGVSTPVESELSDNVTVLYGELPPSGLSANGNHDNTIHLSWFEPGTPPEFELFYDDGGDSDVNGIGWWGGLPSFGWMVAKFQTTAGPATITRIKFKVTDFATAGDPIQVGVFDAAGGLPTFEPLGVVDLTQDEATFNEFREVELTSPVTINGGIFYIGIRQITSNTLAVAGDEGTPFINNTFYYSFDAASWVAYEPNLLTIPMLRCFAIGQFGAMVELEPAPIEVDYVAPVAPTKTEDGRLITDRDESLLTASASVETPYNSLLKRAASAVAPHAPMVSVPEDRAHGNSLDEVLYYIVYRRPAGTGEFVDIGHPTAESYDDTGLPEDTQYDYQVTAWYDNLVESGPTLTVTAECNMAPAPPTNLDGNASGTTQMFLEWVDPIANADGSACVDLEGVQVFRNGTLIATVDAGVQEYTDTPPENNQFYTWTVKAIDEVPNVSAESAGFYAAVVSPWEEVEYEWVDISTIGTSTGITNDDHNVGPFDLGFTVEFMGNSYSSLYVCSNGWASFTSTVTSYFNTVIPDVNEPNAVLYPFWDDMYPPSGGQVLYYQDTANDRFIVTWDAVPHIGSTTELYTFQLIVGIGGDITYNYHTIPVGGTYGNTTATIGVENADGTDAIQISFDGEGWLATSETALAFWGGPAGEIAGLVRAFSSNLPIANVEVSVDEVPGSLALTNAQGMYSLPIEPGTYTLVMHKQGFCDLTFDNVIVEDNNTTTRNGLMRAPNAAFSASSLNMIGHQGDTPSVQFEISNPSGECPVSFTLSTEETWMEFDVESGEVEGGDVQLITVTANTDGLPFGHHEGTLFVNHNDEDSPYELPVILDWLDADDQASLPTVFAFYQNYPNPFNATTALRFDLPNEARVDLVIFNVMGQEVARPVSAVYPAGRHKILYTADALPSGMYLVQMKAGSFTGLHKMVLLK